MRQARTRKTPRQVYSVRTSCIAIMEKKLFVAFLSLLVILEMTSSFPLFRYHTDKSKLESGVESNKLQTRISETAMQGKPDVLLPFARIQRSSKPGRDHDVNKHKHRDHGLSYPHLSKDQSKTSKSSPKRMGAKLLAVFIMVGCLALMSVVFGIVWCMYRSKQSKRVKKATEVDVRSREDVSPQVSQIEYAYVDVGNY